MDTPEGEQKLSIKEILLGVWFNPFENYNKTPYGNIEKDHVDKEINFITPSFAEWGITLDWTQSEYTSRKERDLENDKKAIVVLASEDRIISLPELFDFQQNIEIRLMNLIVGTGLNNGEDYEQWSDNPPPFYITIKTPSGRQYWHKFGQTEWMLANEEHHSTYIPDAASIMEMVEMRIDRVPGA